MIRFLLTSILLGVGLTMDAFSVSIANGLKETDMKKPKMFGVASVYAIFQFAMPLIGWFCVHTILEKFKKFEYAIPFIALALLLYIGIKMIIESIKSNNEKEEVLTSSKKVTFKILLLQGLATSIDALSVGFTIANYKIGRALISSLIIGVVTLIFCLFGLFFGKKIGNKFSKHAEIIGGIILILIGLEIFITGMIDLFA